MRVMVMGKASHDRKRALSSLPRRRCHRTSVSLRNPVQTSHNTR